MTSIVRDDALRGVVLSPRVEEIIRLEKQGDECQWKAARLISEELEAGKTQRQLASEINKSKTHVLTMQRVWSLKRPDDDRPFNQVYNSPEVRGTPKPKGLPKGGGEGSPPSPGKKAPTPERSGEYIALAWQNIAQAVSEVLKMGEPKWSPKVRHTVLAQFRAAVTILEDGHEQ